MESFYNIIVVDEKRNHYYMKKISLEKGSKESFKIMKDILLFMNQMSFIKRSSAIFYDMDTGETFCSDQLSKAVKMAFTNSGQDYKKR